MSDQEVSPERPGPSREDKEESEGESKIKVDENSPETDTKTEDESGLSPPDRSESRESDRPGSSQSAGRPKSSSSDMAHPLKGSRKKKKTNIDPDARQVTFTITICIAVPTSKYILGGSIHNMCIYSVFV